MESGTVISFLPGDDPRAIDALPEFTRALRPEAATVGWGNLRDVMEVREDDEAVTSAMYVYRPNR